MSRLATGLLVAGALLPSFTLPATVERWLRSPRHQVAEGVERWRSGDAEGAAARFETALRLRPTDPRIAFDAGTGRLAAGGRGGAASAAPLLEQAASSSDAALRIPALYNLGNARLAAGDATSAIGAFEEVLRAVPDHADAKHNLEVALREAARPRPQLRSPQASQGGKREGEEEQGEGGGPQDPSQGGQRPDAPQDPGQGTGQPGPQRPGEQPQGDSPMPRFRPQPGMSATQAAAILEAVENREREARRQEAARVAAEQPLTEKDW